MVKTACVAIVFMTFMTTWHPYIFECIFKFPPPLFTVLSFNSCSLSYNQIHLVILFRIESNFIFTMILCDKNVGKKLICCKAWSQSKFYRSISCIFTLMVFTVIFKTLIVFYIFFQVSILNLHSMYPVFTERTCLISVTPDVNIRLIFLILIFMLQYLKIIQTSFYKQAL